MKRVKILCLLLLSLIISGEIIAKPTVISCNPKAKSSFAIFVDSDSYNKCKKELMDYRATLEREGLGTYIIYSNWTTPDEVKAQIQLLAKRGPKLEGMVFVGDIPIARVRRGQHLTTAFKMNEATFPMQESSVTSDRFYDCPDMKFEFICRDSINTNWFYYNLSEEGTQVINPAYYSARILVPEELVKTTGKDKYLLLSNYLKKVVKAHEEQEVLDNLKHFAGHGYNSDCLTAWRELSMLFNAYFPEAFKQAKGNTFINFRQDREIKFKLYNYIQNPETDIFLFYEHGAPETQYINGSYYSTSTKENIELIKWTLRDGYKRMESRNPDKLDSFVEGACKHFSLDKSIFSKEEFEKYRVSDSLRINNKDIHLEDIAKLAPGSRFTMFNACYNGSFHQKGYVAGYHIFADGRTVVTQGNTVNVLQDKWADQLIGLLAFGVRVGHWQNHVTTLESHLVGDPTYRFTPTQEMLDNYPEIAKLNELLLFNNADEKIWEDMLSSKNEVLRALAVKQLSKIYLKLPYDGLRKSSSLPTKLYDIFTTDKSMVVRIQALTALSNTNSDYFVKALKVALRDPFELIRRLAVHWSGKCGEPSLEADIEELLNRTNQAQRIVYACTSALNCFDKERTIDFSSKYIEMDIRSTRNYPRSWLVEELIPRLEDRSIDLDLRIILCESFGWYNYSYKKDLIITKLSNLLDNNTIEVELRKEVKKTLKRLQIL